MSFKRAVLLVLAVLLMPGLAWAQTNTRATFNVDKIFADGNDETEVTVTLSCDTGLPLTQNAQIAPMDDHEFVVVEFTSGELDCTLSESAPAGYSPTYDATGSASSATADADGCHYTAVADGHSNECLITNSPDPITVTITKEWLVENGSIDEVDDSYDIELDCSSEIVGGNQENDGWVERFYGNGEESFSADVIPEFPSTSCTVTESDFDSAVEIHNGCGTFQLSAGDPDFDCTITNTVFFEGIPTLNQYGLAIMALIMLGVGFVGFRRFA